MPEMRRYLDWAVAHREHFLFLVFSLFVGGIVQNKDILLIHAFFVLLLFVLIASFRLGKSAWIFALLASAIFTERIGPDKRLLLVLLFSIVGLLAGAGFSRWKGRKEKSTLKTSPEQEKTEEKKPFFEKEVACRFCGRLISKAELECPHCKKKQYDLSEINTLLEKKGRIQEALDNLELRFMDGDVDGETYKSLKRKWNLRLADIEDKIISAQIRR